MEEHIHDECSDEDIGYDEAGRYMTLEVAQIFFTWPGCQSCLSRRGRRDLERG